MCKIHSCECFNSSLCSKWLSFFYSGNLALANSLWVNLELSIACLLGLTQRLPATSKHMSIGIPLPVCLAVVERRPRSLNHVCSELQSSFIILMECTHEVVSLHPMLSNSYLLSSCFWVFLCFWSAYSIQACNMFVFPVGYFIGHPHGPAWMFLFL